MKQFQYADPTVTYKEIGYAIASFAMAVGILTLPRALANETNYFDGWISIFIGGTFAIFATWVTAKLATRFPKKTFLEFTSILLSKPVAIVLTLSFSVYFLFVTAFEIRVVANISEKYLFERTPVEIIALSFLLVVVYAAAGSSNAILRLNLMFFPIFMCALLLLLALNVDSIELKNLKPMFTTPWTGILKGAVEGFISFLGLEIILFYIAFVSKPKKLIKAAIVGMLVPVLLNFLIFFFVIGIIGQVSVMNMLYPTIEMAKETEIPGGFFARFESLFFTIWIMAIFNTTVMAYDVALLALTSVFTKVKRIHFIYVTSLLLYLLTMTIRDWLQLTSFFDLIDYIGICFAVLLPTIMLVIAKVRKVKNHA